MAIYTAVISSYGHNSFNSAWLTHLEAEIHVTATKEFMKLIWIWAASASQTGVFTDNLNERLYLFVLTMGNLFQALQ